MKSHPVRVLFLCTGNSARSQMAEAFLHRLGAEHFAAVSAGTHPCPLDPLAVQAMAELGIDISGQRSKSLTVFSGQHFDYIITVCDRVRDDCPTFPGDHERIHWRFDDPAAAVGTGSQRLEVFRRVRNEIRGRITVWMPVAVKKVQGY